MLGNTALSYPDDAGMVRVDEESGLGVSVATDANGRYSQLDPRQGAKLALAEAYRNVAVTGAKPMGVSDCLNFGSPENPEVMWQFSETVEGLSDGCLELGIPVTGGNVSFYNQTGDVPIHPTPVIAVLGVIDDVARRVPSGWQDDGHNIYLLGDTAAELDGSAWAGVVHDHLGGRPPAVDLAGEKAPRRAAERGRDRGPHRLGARPQRRRPRDRPRRGGRPLRRRRARRASARSPATPASTSRPRSSPSRPVASSCRCRAKTT